MTVCRMDAAAEQARDGSFLRVMIWLHLFRDR